jgi:hypothetical protein
MIAVFDGILCRTVATINNNPSSLRLKEHDAGALLKELIITGVPSDGVIVDLDPVEGMGRGKRARLKRYSWFLNSGHDLAPKQCDGALYFSKGGVEHFCLIELKSSISGISKGRKQLKSGVAFARYIEQLVNRPLRICTRLVYKGAPLPAPVVAREKEVKEHSEIPVLANSGLAYLSYSQLIG